jgi:hypothetical protein
MIFGLKITKFRQLSFGTPFKIFSLALTPEKVDIPINKKEFDKLPNIYQRESDVMLYLYEGLFDSALNEMHINF